MSERPLILVTNDDGVHSPGLLAAAEAVADLGDLLIVAPASQQTSMSRAFVTGPGMGVIKQVPLDVAGRSTTAYSVTGSPVMAVAHAMLELADRQPALCVSGINYGENIGGALGISGTIGAAMEAHRYAIPALAASIQADVSEWLSYLDRDWDAARYFTRRLAAQILAEGLPGDVSVINLNVPRDATPQTAMRRTVQSRRPYYLHVRPPERAFGEPTRLKVEVIPDPEGAAEPDSDIRAVVCDRVVSVTPLTASMNAGTDWQPAG